MKEYGYTLDTAGALDHGRKVWALAKTGVSEAPDTHGDDKIAAYVLLATSCDKTLATTSAFTSIRVVCRNTLFFAMEDINKERRPQVKVPHNYWFDPAQVKQELGLLAPAWKAFLSRVRKMTTCRMETEQAASFFASLLIQNKHKLLPRTAERECQTLLALFRSAPGQDLTTAKETLWGAVNAVTYYVDHVRSATAGERLDSAWFGTGYALKQKAWANANGMVS
jgi:phage/plasmid-like protein (TIGR03299 family)